VAKTKHRRTFGKQSVKNWLLSYFRPAKKKRPAKKRPVKAKPARHGWALRLQLPLPRRRKIFIIVSSLGRLLPRCRRQYSLPLLGIPFIVLTVGLRRPAGRRRQAKRVGLKLPWQPKAVIYIRPRLVSAAVSLIIGFSGLLYFGAQILKPSASAIVFHPKVGVIQAPSASQNPTTPNMRRSEPVSIHIADVGIDASFVQLGRLADDTLETPADPWTVGWYKQSPTPGEIGPSVVVGHLDSPHNIAVFWRLHELNPGQIVEITRADNSVARFKVDEVNQFSQDSFPTDRVYGPINYAGLRLITCGGVFNHATGHYNQNTVVFASLLP